MSDPKIVKDVLLECAPAKAWTLFTERAGEWWPDSRRHTQDPASRIVMDAAGRFFERATDGREVELGRVREWAPPRRLVLDWYPGTDAGHPTEVVVTFAAEGGATRVVVEHRPLPTSADLWDKRAPRYDASWELVLPAWAAAAKA
jgi:uncharacterized protein YndB with AHSA1/START domain